MEDREPDLRGLNPIGLDSRRSGFWYSFWYSLAPPELVSTWNCNALRMEARVGIAPLSSIFGSFWHNSDNAPCVSAGIGWYRSEAVWY